MERVYVGNLPPDIRIKDIDDFFRPFGKLVYIDVNNRSNPASAFVQFEGASNAYNAVLSRNGYDYEGYTIQVKLVGNKNDNSFEVRNQRGQLSPPPPPPMFNDFNNYGGNNNNNNRGNNNRNFDGNYGNNRGNNFGNFGNNMGSMGQNSGNNYVPNNNYNNPNFMNSSSSFQSSNMVQYPTINRSNMAQQKMIEYPNVNRWGGSGSNVGGGSANRAGNSNIGGGPVRGGSNRGAVQNRAAGVNRAVGSNRAAGPNRDAGSNRAGGAPNRSGVSNRAVGASVRTGPSNRPGGGGGVVKDNSRYADVTFEDRYTLGLSGSGRKWFNRYISKGFTPELSRTKALEHRTAPYGQKMDSIPNNASNYSLPELESIGNQLISLFSASGIPINNFVGGGNNSQALVNYSGFGGAGPSSKNARPAKKDEKADGGILKKMLEKIPSIHQQYIVGKAEFNKSKEMLTKLNAKKTKGRLTQKELDDQIYHKKIVNEYQSWEKEHQSTLNTSKGKGKTPEQLLSEYNTKKDELLKEAEKMEHPIIVPGEAIKRFEDLMRDAALEEQDARILSILPIEKLIDLIQLNTFYEVKTGKNVIDKKYTPEEIKVKAKIIRSTNNTYRSTKKFLKKYEDRDLDTLTDKDKALLRMCLKRKRRIEQLRGVPVETLRYDFLLTEEDLKKKDEDAKVSDENVKSEENPDEENADITEDAGVKEQNGEEGADNECEMKEKAEQQEDE